MAIVHIVYLYVTYILNYLLMFLLQLITPVNQISCYYKIGFEKITKNVNVMHINSKRHTI